MQKIEELARELREVQGGVNEVLRDTLGDYKQREAAREKRDLRKDITIWLLIVALVGSFIYYQWSFKKFIEQYDFETIITQETQADDHSSAININGGGSVNGSTSIPTNNTPDAPEGQ